MFFFLKFPEIFKYVVYYFLDMRSKGMFIGFFVYLVFGAYLLNFPFEFVQIPEMISKFDSWIFFIGGILLVFGGINFLRASKNF